MAKLTYEEMMKKVNEELTDELINEVIQEMGIEDDILILDGDLIAHQSITQNISYSTSKIQSEVKLNDGKSIIQTSSSTYDVKVANDKRYYEENTIEKNEYFQVSA